MYEKDKEKNLGFIVLQIHLIHSELKATRLNQCRLCYKYPAP